MLNTSRMKRLFWEKNQALSLRAFRRSFSARRRSSKNALGHGATAQWCEGGDCIALPEKAGELHWPAETRLERRHVLK